MKSEAVDKFLDRVKTWKEEMTLLREFCLHCGLTEDFKWMHPCYNLNGKNIVLIHQFKEYCALLFHKGVLMKDSENLLIQQTENVQTARQLRFTNLKEISDLEKTVKAYIFEAIEIEKAGLKVTMKKTAEFNMSEELESKFKEDPKLKAAFEALTPGRQRGYLLHFYQPKQAATRVSRIEKNMTKIFAGKGFNER